ncbi:sensor histidine kinase [Brevibacillus sp. H7]|uniref:sensor histidine kinase n=1 Tax=Brevibacillus sp. H7 TaxID=3349138 RepID=UPI00380B355D
MEKRKIGEAGFARGVRDGETGWATKDVVLEINHNSRTYIFHHLLKILEQEPDVQIKSLLIERLHEVNSLRFISYMRGYLMVKDNQIDTLHQQKISIMGQMAAGMAHEIRNPITSFQGFVQLMKQDLMRGNFDPETFLQYLTICQEEIKVLEGLVSNFLILARKNETVNKQLEMIRLQPILERINQLSKHFVIEKDVNLSFCYNGQKKAVWGVASYIEQICLNLIKNAVDAVGVRGDVRVTAVDDAPSEQVVIEFTDNGCGIAEERMKHLFEPFYTTKEKGTGIGLSVCKQLIEEMGGQINIRSTVGTGTKIEVRLQMART